MNNWDLANNQAMENVKVDSEDQYLLEKYNWWIKSNGYVVAKIDNKIVLLHRVIMKAEPGQELDHINRDRLDNRRANLRFSNRYDQMKNATYKLGKSGVTGVVPHGDHWTARRRVNGKRLHLGCFTTIEEAKRVYESMG